VCGQMAGNMEWVGFGEGAGLSGEWECVVKWQAMWSEWVLVKEQV
jgi:hypothetical protein